MLHRAPLPQQARFCVAAACAGFSRRSLLFTRRRGLVPSGFNPGSTPGVDTRPDCALVCATAGSHGAGGVLIASAAAHAAARCSCLVPKTSVSLRRALDDDGARALRLTSASVV